MPRTRGKIAFSGMHGFRNADAVGLGRRRFEEGPSFRVPAGPVVAALGVSFSLWLLTTRTFDQAGLLVLLSAAGLLLRAVTRRLASA